MGLNNLRKSASGGITKILLFGFLAMAVGGLVLMDVGGVFRGGVSFGDVAEIGNEPITLNSFDKNVRSTLSQIGMPPAQAYQFGYIDQILGREIRSRVLAQTARNQSIMISDRRVAKTVKQLIEPIAARENEDPKDIFNRILLNQGLSENAFVQSIKNEEASLLLTSAIEAGFSKPAPQLVRNLYEQQNETRDIEFITFLDAKAGIALEPTDEQLETLYDATREQYAMPERRIIHVATINTKSLEDTLVISDEEILAEYEDNIDFYHIDKTQTLDQALLDTEEDAKEVLQEVKSGKSLKEAVQAATGKAIGYLGEQILTDGDLLEAIKDEILANQIPGEILGPIQSPLGWYIIHIKAIEEAHTQNFDDVKDEIRENMIEMQLADQEYELANNVDDMLAGGSSLDEIMETIPLNIKILPPVDRTGTSAKEGENVFGEFEKQRAIILEDAFEIGAGESSNVIETDDGDFIIVHVKKIQEKTYPEFASVKPTLKKKWITDQRRIENRILVNEMMEELKSSGETLKEFAASKGKILSRRDGLGRNDNRLESPLTPRTVGNLFEVNIGEPIIVSIEGGSAIAVVQSYHWPENIDENSEDYLELAAKIERDIKNEAVIMFLTKKQNEIGIKINRGLLERVYGTGSDMQ